MRSQPPKRSLHAPIRLLAALAAATLVAAALIAPALATAAPRSAASHTQPKARTVVVLITPFLTWSDVLSPAAPAFQVLAGSGAIGNMNSVTADPGWPTVPGGALTLSASRWAAAPLEISATATNLAAFRKANLASLNVPDLGALGSVLRASALKTAAVGNADENTSTAAGIRRPAELVATDRSGHIDTVLTGQDLLAADPSAPYGVRTDPQRLAAGIAAALAKHPALLVVDPGDLERSHDAPARSDAVLAADHTRAVASANAALQAIVRNVGVGDVVAVVTPATDKPYYQPPYLGPTIIAGPGYTGDLTSGSTQRPGLVTNLDVAPTILSALWAEPAPSMLGQPMRAVPTGAGLEGGAGGPELFARIAGLARLDASVGAVDYVRDLFFIRYFAWTVVWIALLAAVVALVPVLGPARLVARLAILFALCVPSGTWLMFVLDRYPLDGTQVAVAFGAATLAVFAVMAALNWVLRSRPEAVLLVVSALTSLLICADQWTGHPLDSGLFSYSIRSGWRYYGMGNEGAAILVGASLAAVGLACHLAESTRWERAARLALPPVVGLTAVVTAAAPFAGANAGAAVWGVVAFGVAWARINRLRFTWRTAGAIVGAIVVIVAAIAMLDVMRGAGETHIGRFFSGIAAGDFAATRDLVVRKALNNYNYVQQTPYTWLALAVAAALAAAQWLGSRPLAAALKARPAVGAAVLGVVVGGLVALVTEDSGSVMPALMLFAGGLPALYLALLPSHAENSAN